MAAQHTENVKTCGDISCKLVLYMFVILSCRAVSWLQEGAGHVRRLMDDPRLMWPEVSGEALTVQTFQSAQTAAQNLATTINTSPGSVLKTLVTQSIHGRVTGVMIWGPSAAPPSGELCWTAIRTTASV